MGILQCKIVECECQTIAHSLRDYKRLFYAKQAATSQSYIKHPSPLWRQPKAHPPQRLFKTVSKPKRAISEYRSEKGGARGQFNKTPTRLSRAFRRMLTNDWKSFSQDFAAKSSSFPRIDLVDRRRQRGLEQSPLYSTRYACLCYLHDWCVPIYAWKFRRFNSEGDPEFYRGKAFPGRLCEILRRKGGDGDGSKFKRLSLVKALVPLLIAKPQM